MLLKVAVIDERESYRERFVAALAADYADNLEVSSFSSLASFGEYVTKTTPVDVMLVSSAMGSEQLDGNHGAILLYLVEDKSIERLYGRGVICRYQKVEAIYKALIDACLDRFDVATFHHETIENTNVITFFPASGGAGASTMAAACALSAAKRGLRAFYLNLELYGRADTYFTADGTGNLSDVLFAIESRKHNISTRIQGLVKRSRQGVHFIDSCPSPLDLAELTPRSVDQLLHEIAASARYDIIVIDLDYPHSAFASVAMQMSNRVVFVSNGTRTSNDKFARIYDALNSMGLGASGGLDNIVLAFNNFDSRTGSYLMDDDVEVVGALASVPHASQPQLVEALSNGVLFSELLAFDEDRG